MTGFIEVCEKIPKRNNDGCQTALSLENLQYSNGSDITLLLYRSSACFDISLRKNK